MSRFKLTLEYEGTRYSGWQIQKNARTIQGELENSVRQGLALKEFEIQGAGRTDAGVHALAQVAHLDGTCTLPMDAIRHRLNDSLPPDINILRVEPAHSRFHARHHAESRTYLYQISRRRTALAKRFVWWIKDELNAGAMRRAAQTFVGMKDFRSFTRDNPGEKSTRIFLSEFVVHETGDLILFRVTGSHFLWNSVRRMVGTLAEIGRGSMKPERLATLLTTESDEIAHLTAPPSGLFLERITYAGDPPLPSIRPVLPLG
jgi:tRNA pseudouridine38-40 synthase